MRIKFSDIFLVPNLITLIRLFLLPIILIFLIKEVTLFLILILVVIFSLSDILDGYLARRLNQISDLGKILDPLLDKLGIALFAIYAVIYKGFPLWAMIAVVAKDVIILLVGMVLIKSKKQIPVANYWGKVTLCLWGAVLFSYIFEIPLIKEPLLIVATIMLFLNLVYYTKRFVDAVSVSSEGNPGQKKWLKNLTEDLKSFLLRMWLIITNKAFQIVPRLGRVSVFVLCLVFLSVSIYILNKYYGQIVDHLIRLNVDSQGNSTGFFSTLFITLGASILAVLAITFSLSLFALQQAGDRYTPAILSNILKDKVTRCIFWIIAGISLTFFLFAFLPLNNFLFYEVVSGFVFLIVVFFLLRKQYKRVTILINPIYQIMYYRDHGIKLLNRINRDLDIRIKAKVVRPGPNSNIKNASIEEQRDVLRGGLIFRFPNIFNGVKDCLNQIYTLIRTYQNRKEYQVTQSGFNVIYLLVYKYIDVKNGTFFPSSPIPALDYSRDDFLTDVFEKHTAIQRVASREKDLEISEQILDCFFKIAVKCTEIRYRTNPMNEYTHCMLATEYMQQNIIGGLNEGLLNIGIQGSDRLMRIGLTLIAKGSQTDVNLILNHLSKIAMYGLLPNTSYLMASPMKAYSILLRGVLYSKNIDYKLLSKTILGKAQYIISSYIKIKEAGIISVEMDFSIGNFVDLSRQTSIPYIFSEVNNRIRDPKISDPEKKCSIESVTYFGHEVWHFYDELAKCAAEKESFLIHYIDAGIEHITISLLELYQMDIVDQRHKKEILQDIERLISNYWRVYDYHKKITGNYEHLILWHLLRIGSEFNRLSLIENLNEVIGIIISIANSFLEKHKDIYGFHSMRILEKAAYLCILNSSKGVYVNFLKRIKDKFWSKYCKKYPQHKTLLFNELLRIDPVHIKLNRPHLSFEDELLSQLNRGAIKKFADKLAKDLEL